MAGTPAGQIRIEDLEAGDLVYAYDEEEGELVIREVVQTFERTTTALIDLVVGYPEDGTESTISGTAEHPFFVPEYGGYVPMGELYEGMELLGVDGEPLVVVRLEIREGNFEVFNFEVGDAHNYYVVGDGDLVGLLVHNTCLAGILNRAANARLTLPGRRIQHALQNIYERTGIARNQGNRAIRDLTRRLRNGDVTEIILDAHNADRIIVPGLGNGAAVYRLHNGRLELRTILELGADGLPATVSNTANRFSFVEGSHSLVR